MGGHVERRVGDGKREFDERPPPSATVSNRCNADAHFGAPKGT